MENIEKKTIMKPKQKTHSLKDRFSSASGSLTLNFQKEIVHAKQSELFTVCFSSTNQFASINDYSLQKSFNLFIMSIL